MTKTAKKKEEAKATTSESVTPSTPKALETAKTRPVLICTEFRGVFFGYTADPHDATTVKLENFRNCLYWEKAVGGVFGLAQAGPSGPCKIGAKVTGPAGIQKVTCVIDATEEAAKAWEAAPSVS